MKPVRNLKAIITEKLLKPSSKFERWAPVLLWALVIFFLSSIPQAKAPKFFIWDFVFKKIAHVSEYAILFFLLFRATDGKWKTSFVISIIYAVTDEIHQAFVPGRTPKLYDVLGFDLTGINISAYVLWKLKLKQKLKHKK